MAYKIMIDEQYEDMRAFLTSIPSIFDTEGVEIYDGRNTIKSFTLPNGETINVKRFRKPSFFNLLVYSFNIRKPKGLRAFQFPYILKEKQIETPQSVVYIEERNGLHLLQYTYYAYIKCPWRLSRRTCTTKGFCIKTFRLVIFFGIRTKRDITLLLSTSTEWSLSR